MPKKMDEPNTPAAALAPDAKPAPEPTVSLDPQRWVAEHGDALFRFVLTRVRDRSIAEDLVQETFLAALGSLDRFAGRSSERAWLFGILRNKLVDYYRQQTREKPLADVESLSEEEDACFHTHGLGKDGWIKRLGPKSWPSPDESLVMQEFWRVFHDCVSRLPEKIGQVFLRREMDEVPSAEICKELKVSANNLWVMLHRARLALRRCLEVHWFGRRQP